MDPLLYNYHTYLGLDKRKDNYKNLLPLTLIKRAVRRPLLELQATISEPITRETWQRFIHSKAHRFLNLLVALDFLSEEWSDYWLQLLDECRSLLFVSPFLVLPSPITRVGILYAQFVLPSARSMLARGKIIEVLYLQYWVLNNLLSVGVSILSWVWWFVPFSTQIVFAVWCYLTFPRTITEYYAYVEMELITFGILSGESELSVEDTITVSAIRSVVKRIPSANDAGGFQWAVMDLDDSNHSIKNKKKMVPRRNSAPATLLAKTVSEAMMAREALSPQEEEEEDFDESDTEQEQPKQFSQSMSALPALSTKNRTVENHKTLPPPSSSIMVGESDDSSFASTAGMVDVDLSEIRYETSRT